MKRFRLTAWATLVGLGLTSGCSTFGNGSSSSGNGNGFFSRLFHRNNACEVGCPCDMGCCGSGFGGGFGGCCGTGCDGGGGPMVMDPWSGAMPPGAVGGLAPGAITPQTGVPPLAPTPQFTAPVPQAQPAPAGPVSRAK